MDTNHVIGELLAYLEGMLSAADRDRVTRHLNECAACQAEYSTLAEMHHLLNRSLKAEAARVAAPAGSWARFETRLTHQTNAPRATRGRMKPTMNTKTHSSRRLTIPVLLFAGAAAAMTLIIAGIAAYLLFLPGTPQVASGNPATATPIITSTQIVESPTLSPEQVYGTQRPQSGGGSGQPDGGNGNLVPTWQGIVRSVDPVARTITLDPDGQVVQVMDFTEFIIEDITWIGARAAFEDIQPGMQIQADLFSDSPPFARIIWIQRTQAQFWEDGSYELNAGTIMSFDSATNTFTVEPLVNDLYQITSDARILIDTDAIDGQPATIADVQVGQSVNFVSLLGTSQPHPVVLLMIIPPDPESLWEWFWATVTEANPGSITVQPAEGDQPMTLDLGPADYAASQGITFAPGDLIAFRVSRDGAQLTAVEVIKLATGEWLRLRDVNGPLWPNP